MRFLSWFLDQVEKALIRITIVTTAKPVEYPKIIDNRETEDGGK